MANSFKIAVNRAKRSIKALLDVRPDTVSVAKRSNLRIHPSDIVIGEIIQVRAGEKVAHGLLLSKLLAQYRLG
jgi:Cd2+/Zn2+-exporting ATPase